MTRIQQEEAIHPDGWSRWVYPVMEGYKLSCCDCGLVHDVEFRITDDYDRVEFRMRRNNRSTGQVRRHRPSQEVAGERLASAVSKALRNPKSSKAAKSAASLALTHQHSQET